MTCKVWNLKFIKKKKKKMESEDLTRTELFSALEMSTQKEKRKKER